jgi:hypothetical protein
VGNLPGVFSVVLLALLLILSGCAGPTGADVPVDRSFLTDEPCAAPCWYGLVPGKSSKDDAPRVLAELPFVNQATIREESYELYGREEIAITCQFKNQNGFGVGINIYDDIVRQISLASHGLNLEDVAQKLGDPDHARVFLYGKGTGYQVDIFYVRRGIQVRSFQTIGVLLGNKYLTRSSDGPWRVLLSKEMQVDNLIYVPPADSIEEFYASQIPYDPDTVKGILEYISPWPGWGESVPLG